MEIGRRAGLDTRAVEQAALAHHAPDARSLGLGGGLGRLAWEVVCGDRAQEVLAIVRLANLLDEQFEALEFEHKALDTILREVQSFGQFEGFDPALVDHVKALRCHGFPGALQLPVETKAAGRVFRALRAERECDLDAMERIALGDAALTGSLLAVANSALYGRPIRVGTVKRAISTIGLVAARKVMLGAAMKPVFASAGLSQLWSHSVSAAPMCASLAEHTGLLTVEEGLVLGLVHDIGAVALQFLPREALTTYRRMMENGCPATYVERLLLAQDHGELGAAFLAEWNFPEDLMEAVRFHHQPERSNSRLPALAYLAEFWSGMSEDLPSFGRVDACLARTGLTLETMLELCHHDPAMRALRSVA
jgi:HD-like signal output (HDOD) protein